MRDLEQTATKPERLVSLDNFRGITIAAMIIVNNPGTWGAMYKPLTHAQWDGWTPTDFIFPFFLFIVGVAMVFSLDRRLNAGAPRGPILRKAGERAAVLFALGMIMTGFPNLRLLMPWLLLIAGLKIAETGESKENGKPWLVGGLATLGAAFLWFILDFAHFQGDTVALSWKALFPLTNDLNAIEGVSAWTIRVPGVLARIALAYILGTIVMVFCRGWKGRTAWAVGLMVLYYLICLLIDAPDGYDFAEGVKPDAPADAPFPGLLHDWIDVKLLGDHLYSHRPDPEGLLSTIPSVATVLLGVLTGQWLRKEGESPMRRAAGMAIAGAVLLVLGLAWDLVFPINKKIWTSSYVLLMGGWALLFLALCYWLNDVMKWRKWSVPFVIFGMNAILLFFGSGIVGRLLIVIKVGEGVALKTWIYNNLFDSWIGPDKLASFSYSVVNLALWLVVLTVFYKKKWFLKV
ncbi:MAG: hypothetical protein RLY93_15120 [Sumerlaeia bacterium]